MIIGQSSTSDNIRVSSGPSASDVVIHFQKQKENVLPDGPDIGGERECTN